jgi:hypothetical protein
MRKTKASLCASQSYRCHRDGIAVAERTTSPRAHSNSGTVTHRIKNKNVVFCYNSLDETVVRRRHALPLLRSCIKQQKLQLLAT